MTTPTPWDSRTLRTAFATGDEFVIQPAGAGTDFVRLPWSVLEDLIDAAGGLTQSGVDGRIAAWARITPVGDVPDSSIPDAITRDTELGDYALLAGATFLGLVSGLDPVDAQNFVTKAHGDANYATSGGFTLRTGNGAPATSLGEATTGICASLTASGIRRSTPRGTGDTCPLRCLTPTPRTWRLLPTQARLPQHRDLTTYTSAVRAAVAA